MPSYWSRSCSLKDDLIVCSFDVRNGLQHKKMDVHCISIIKDTGLHKLWYPSIQDTSKWSKFRAHGEHGDVFLFSNLGAL